MAAPTIPPRPSRSQNAASSPNMDLPKIPPRPKRSIERSVSPNRDTFARSPLNDPSFLHTGMKNYQKESNLSVEVPPRPPSVTLPSIGQEGSEYASLEDLTQLQREDSSPQRTSNVAGDLPLHAPTASVPSSTAKSRIQTVTRTDSSQAAAAGIGKLFPDDKPQDSSKSDTSTGSRTRPQSILKDDEEHGIPEIGVQVPMYPNAGDVQAPTPSPYGQGVPTGVGFFNKGDQPSGRHHGRTKSGREIFHGPPGSYGLHGHGVIPNDEFEKNWYAKHPEDLAREKKGEYGPHIQENRKDYHWMGDDLQKLVHHSGSKGVGMGASREAIGTPDEQVGYRASEEFASRMTSPRPTSSSRPPSIHAPKARSGSQVESPLRQMNFPVDQLERKKTHESTFENESEEDVIHIDPPPRSASKVGGGGYDPPTEDLGPHGGNTAEEGGWVDERGYGVPILASDEVAKRPGSEYMQPAISPELERRGSGEYTLNEDGVPQYITHRRSNSRPSSRNNSIQSGSQLQRFASNQSNSRTGTPLESHREYEPLFPEDEHDSKPKKGLSEKLKRPDLARHHFPSQDVWEDTPSSLQLETTVDSPQVSEELATSGDGGAGSVFEKPEVEKARKEEITAEDQKSFLPEHTKRFAKTGFNKDVLGDMPTRPGMQQRFPSQDIWEDSPSYHSLETTVNAPQTEDTNEYADEPTSSTSAKPTIPAKPQKDKDISPVGKKGPVVPERPKPQVPARPSKPLTKSSEKVPTTSTIESKAETAEPKAKPPVPARPGGSKIAALQSGFLKDLNSKIGLGPQAPKVKEPEPEEEPAEVKPLQDARKGRAKGPQRRKPTSSPSPAAAIAATEAAPAATQKLGIAGINTIFSISDAGDLDVPAAKMAAAIQSNLKAPKKVEEPDIVEETLEKSAAVEPEEAELAKIVSKGSDLTRTETQDSESPSVLQKEEPAESPLEKKKSLEDTPSSAISHEPKEEEEEVLDDPKEAVKASS